MSKIYMWDFPLKITPFIESQRERLLNKCCFEFCCTVNDVREGKRTHNVSRARMVYSYLIRKHLADSYTQIARFLNANHSSVMSMVNKAQDYIDVKAPDHKIILVIEKDFLTNQL